MNHAFKLTIAGLVLAISGVASAGQDCAGPLKFPRVAAAKAIRSAKETRLHLEKGPDTVVLLARMGQNLTQYGLTYSHAAYAVKQDDGVWVVVHSVNECGTATSSVVQQSLEEFFMGDFFRQQAGVWRLDTLVQERLKESLLGGSSTNFHNPNYNMAAYPFTLGYQNSNGWVLEVLATAINPSLQTRAQAVTWLKERNYRPSVLQMNALQRMGAHAADEHITFDDQPSKERWANKVHVATVDSIIEFMRTVKELCQRPNCVEERLPNF